MPDEPLESLGYFLREDINMNEFKEFCKNGKRDAAGNPIFDAHTGAFQTGVLPWLASNGIREAHFLFTADGMRIPAFAVNLTDSDSTWSSLPGFRQFLRVEPVVLDLNEENLGGINLRPDADLDATYEQLVARVDRLPQEARAEILPALRGETDKSLRAFYEENVEETAADQQ